MTKPFLLEANDRQNEQLMPLSASDIEAASGAHNCTDFDQTIGGFTVCGDLGNIFPDPGNPLA